MIDHWIRLLNKPKLDRSVADDFWLDVYGIGAFLAVLAIGFLIWFLYCKLSFWWSSRRMKP